MNKIIFCLIILICTTLYAQDVGYLSVSVDPDIEIFLDSTLIADESFTRLAITPGTYELIVVDTDNFSWNKKAKRETIQILNDVELTRDYRSENFRNIYSQPVAADVYLGSIMLGRTPITLKKELLTDQSITLSKNGYKEKTFTLEEIDNNQYLTLSKMDPDDNPAVFEAALGATQVNLWRESLIVTSVLGSWAAFLFKRKADQNYENYLSSSNQVLMQQYFDEAQRFDRYSEVAIGISVVALSVYMIILMTE